MFDRGSRSIVVPMRTASAVAPLAGPRTRRPHLVLVTPPPSDRPATRHERLAALLAGLLTGFLLAALAAVAGGGSAAGALTTSAGIGLLLGIVLIRARVVTVRARRRRRAASMSRVMETQASVARAA